MSGIAGIIHFDGKPIEPDQVEAMTAAMHYRGPDGINHWRKGNVALGQCMLRTTPESLEEIQPLTNEDESLVLVMDGRVDNYDELRRELLGRGAVLRTRADAELVLWAYEVWGEDCADRVIGECVFFIWDARRQRLFAARDAAGTRHFYYHQGQDWFAFASEIKGLLTLPRIEHRLNESRLLDYLVVEFDRDDEVGTFYQDILRMPAGHAMTVTERGPRIWRFWNPGKLTENRFASLEECAEAFLEQLRVTVKCRLRSIGPIGAMLSGGLDSSSIVGLISKEFRADLKQPLKTFSLIREDRENCSDWSAIREMLMDDWLDPTIITSSIGSDICQSYLDNIKNLNEPFAHSGGFTDSLVFDAARERGCRVVFDGMAGDLLFYGLARSMDAAVRRKMFSQVPFILTAYKQHRSINGRRTLMRSVLRLAAPESILTVYRALRSRMVTGLDAQDEMPGNLMNFLHFKTAKQFLAAKHDQRNKVKGYLKPSTDQDAHSRNFTTGMLSFGHEVIGQIALSKGIEPRSPFSDRRMIEFAIQMPLQYKLSKLWYKPVLRASMNNILPQSVRLRTDVGEHPGWKFFERFILHVVQSKPEIWECTRVGNALGRWIDTSHLDHLLEQYKKEKNYTNGYNLVILLILSKWMKPRSFDLHATGELKLLIMFNEKVTIDAKI